MTANLLNRIKHGIMAQKKKRMERRVAAENALLGRLGAYGLGGCSGGNSTTGQQAQLMTSMAVVTSAWQPSMSSCSSQLGGVIYDQTEQDLILLDTIRSMHPDQRKELMKVAEVIAKLHPAEPNVKLTAK